MFCFLLQCRFRLFCTICILTKKTFGCCSRGNSSWRFIGPGLKQTQHRFSAFWLRSKCSICSYQLNIWYGLHSRSRILNWFLTDWIQGWACSPGSAGCHGIALPPWAASLISTTTTTTTTRTTMTTTSTTSTTAATTTTTSFGPNYHLAVTGFLY